MVPSHLRARMVRLEMLLGLRWVAMVRLAHLVCLGLRLAMLGAC